MDIKKWYGSHKVPRSFEDQNSIRSFISSCQGIFSSVVASNLGVKVKVAHTNNPEIQIAAASTETNTIYFSRSLYSENENERFNPKATIEEVLTAIMGITIHESAHFAYTTKSYEEVFEFLGVALNHSLYGLMNLIDDIYIDQKTHKLLPKLGWTIEGRLNYIFDKEKIEERFKALEDGPITTIDQMIAYSNACATFKNFFFDTYGLEPRRYEELKGIMMKARRADDIIERGRIAIELFENLTRDIESSGDQGDSSNDSNDSSNNDEDGEDETEELLEKLAKALAAAIEENIEMFGHMFSDEVSDEISADDEIVSVDMDASLVSSAQNRLDIEVPFEYDVLSKVLRHMSSSSEIKDVEIDERYVKLSQVINARSQRRTSGGPQLNRGNNINMLYRIVTDGKIYNRPVVQTSLGPQEVIIFIDCSGSMNGKPINSSMEAAMGAAKGLVSGGHKVAVYGHTSELGLSDGAFSRLVIFKFKDFNESLEVLNRRLGLLYAGSSSYHVLSQNDDDLAIEAISKKFTSARNTKTLLVISDGSPYSSRFSGLGRFKTTERMQNAISAAKKMFGGKIISISITEEADKANEDFYGSDNNVFNEDPNVIEEIIRRMT